MSEEMNEVERDLLIKVTRSVNGLSHLIKTTKLTPGELSRVEIPLKELTIIKNNFSKIRCVEPEGIIAIDAMASMYECLDVLISINFTKNNKDIPSVFSKLIRWVQSPTQTEAILGDLDENYAYDLEKFGARYAKRRYNAACLNVFWEGCKAWLLRQLPFVDTAMTLLAKMRR